MLWLDANALVRLTRCATCSVLTADDQAALVTFSHVVAQLAPLTHDFGRVRAALDATPAPGDTALVGGRRFCAISAR